MKKELTSVFFIRLACCWSLDPTEYLRNRNNVEETHAHVSVVEIVSSGFHRHDLPASQSRKTTREVRKVDIPIVIADLEKEGVGAY